MTNSSLLFLLIGVGVLIVSAMRENVRLTKLIKKHSGKTRHLPKAMSLLIITAQLSELVKMVGQVSLVNVAASLFLLTIAIATKTGTEGELR